ncbi:MAG: N-acetylmuramoyl-L-alanine amidase [Chlamydiia bacterium]|nr:N-acetylmuramoyl-L-alanine amidase [Chlamydiia bacterium]
MRRALPWLKFSLLALILIFAGCSRAPVRQRSEEIAYVPPPVPKLLGPVVIIDPGHGGKDLGTHSDKPPMYAESALALETSLLLEHYLRALGYRTVMTRSDDIFISLKARSEIANDLQSKVFVSMHYNSAENKAAEGLEVFYYQSDKDPKRSKESKLLAQDVLDEVVANTGIKSRGVKHGNFSVIRETKMPAIIVEGGFLTNPSERDRILRSGYIRELAMSVAAGVDRYIKKK